MRNNLFISLFKQAPNGLLAHVYEHAYSMQLQTLLRDAGLYEVVDYSMWAKTYGVTCIIELRVSSIKSARIVRKAIRKLAKTTLSTSSIKHAAEECACEYDRPLLKIGAPFYKQVAELHTTPWNPIQSLETSVATIDTAVDTVFSIPGLEYGKKAPKKFGVYDVHFEIPKNLYENNPSLKVLAIFLIQAVSLNLLFELKKAYRFYDNGDEWNNGARKVEYRNELIFLKPGPEEQSFEKNLATVIEQFKTAEFSVSVQAVLKKSYKNDQLHYFTLQSINAITDGTIVGYAMWRKVSTEENIRKLLSAIKVTVK